ncbi:MAG: sensor histidine kinase [Christensenellales bacterium]|jgi:two-component system sensor histidine kinase YesM
MKKKILAPSGQTRRYAPFFFSSGKTISRRLIAAYLAFYLLPMFVFSSFSYVQRQQTAIDNAHQMLENARTAVQADIHYMLNQTSTSLQTVATNTLILDYLENYSSNPHDYFMSAMWEFGPLLNSIIEINPMIASVRIYALDENIPRFRNVIYPAGNLKYTGHLKEIEALGYSQSWLSHSQELYQWQTQENMRDWLFHYTNPDPIVYSMFRKLYSDKTNAHIGYIEVSIRATDLLTWATFNREGISVFFLEEGKGLVDFENDVYQLKDVVEKNAIGPIDRNGVTRLNGRKMFVVVDDLDAPQVQMILTLPYDQVLGSVASHGYDIAVGVVVGALLLLVFVFRIFKNVPTRLNLLVDNIEKLRAGEADVALGDDEGDEISLVNETLSQLIDHNNRLINTVYKVQLAEKDAKLSYLEAQIDPHFLFNSLEAIRMSAQLARAQDVADALVALSSVLRVRINYDGMATLEQETYILRNYIFVENIRLENRVMLEIIADEGLEGSKMPSLLLQPLAENAVRHGMQRAGIMLLIKVEILRREGGRLLIRITDNGDGMDVARLEEITAHMKNMEEGQALSNAKANGVGLSNIYQRLKLIYGDQAQLDIVSIAGSGTQIEIIIPQTDAIKDEEFEKMINNSY